MTKDHDENRNLEPNFATNICEKSNDINSHVNEDLLDAKWVKI